MRIRYKIALVGGIPITIAAAIAVAAGLLLTEADRARSGAVQAGSAYRNLLTVMSARDDYLAAFPPERAEHAARFTNAAERATQNLDALTDSSFEDERGGATRAARSALARYGERMRELIAITGRNDGLIAEMGAKAGLLIELTDRARARQHASNADIIASLKEGGRRITLARDIVDSAQELRAAMLACEVERTRARTAAPAAAGQGREAGAPSMALARFRKAAADLTRQLRAEGPSTVADELAVMAQLYAEPNPAEPKANEPKPASSGSEPKGAVSASVEGFSRWVDRLIKVNSTEHRALQDETAQLLAYSVQAAETEQATQNTAIATLKLERRTADAFAARDFQATAAILEDGRKLSATVMGLPISPLIQTEMIDAIERWREGLATTGEGLRAQNATVADMDAMAPAMINGAVALNAAFTQHADRIGQFVRTILALGAGIGLLLGSGTAFFVARSITGPLKDLQENMRRLAADPTAGQIRWSGRRDELGAMARATNLFVTEIGRRERALRHAKEEADATLSELRETQANLIQAEKLASLGQLVAGVAHEINTPVGVALTTSTTLEGDVRRLGTAVESGRLLRSELTHTVGRLNEGARLLFSNLTRAAELVQSFKQVATDQASGERRPFKIKAWLHDILTSLGPVLRKKGHEIAAECPPDLVMDSYPGALAQVLTNLVMNAVTHAYPDDRAGRMKLTVLQPKPGMVRFTFTDDGAGIAPEHFAKVFDPFFTTGRDRGSTGLGLHIVYNLVTATLGGRIEMESERGQGTTFTIELPLTLAQSAPRPALATA